MCAKTKLATIAALFTMLSIATGCSSATTATAPRVAGGWETKQLAPGIELRIDADASPSARQAAEELQAEYRSTYLNAR